MTDSNVGARKERNIRDNLFVVHGVVNSVVKKEMSSIDLAVYDLAKCFDSLWLQEIMNDLYEAGVDNDNFVLLYEENKNNLVAIKTAYGLTDRFTLDKIVMQGTVFGPLKCAVQMDKLGRLSYNRGSPLLLYKKTVEIPPLGMIDDILAMSPCGFSGIQSNSVINSFVESKRLQFGEKKCHKLHIGESTAICPPLAVHDSPMASSEQEKYIGDIIERNGTNSAHFKERIDRGWAIKSEILAILREVPLGHHEIEAGLILRNAMFVNGVLSSMEVRYGIREREIRELEKIDEELLRKIVRTSPKVSLASIYLECSVTPLRYLVMQRRLNYLHHILTRDKSELISRIYLSLIHI